MPGALVFLSPLVQAQSLPWSKGLTVAGLASLRQQDGTGVPATRLGELAARGPGLAKVTLCQPPA